MENKKHLCNSCKKRKKIPECMPSPETGGEIMFQDGMHPDDIVKCSNYVPE